MFVFDWSLEEVIVIYLVVVVIGEDEVSLFRSIEDDVELLTV